MRILKSTERLAVHLLLALPVIAGTNPSTTTLNSSANPSVYGHGVTLTATVEPVSATGTVTFYSGITVLETEPLINGEALFTTTLLDAGVLTLRAYYGGDVNYAGSNSGVLTQTVATVPENGFQVPVDYSVSGATYWFALGDLNGDGKTDLAVSNGAGNTVSVLLGNGNGTFQEPVNYDVAQIPTWVAVGDFNGDGKPDLAVAAFGSGEVSILLGNGDGTFQAAVDYGAGESSAYLAVSDFNGDGKADLAVADQWGGLNVLLGNGDGTFQAALNVTSGGTPLSVAVGDFNGDGNADLAVSNFEASVGAPNGVSIFLGNGDGTFQPAISCANNTNPQTVAVGDFNGDGKADLAVAAFDSDGVTVLLGNGDGTFQAGVNFALGYGPTAVAIGDFNGDGKPDLAVSGNGNAFVSTLLSNGDGTFQAAVNYGVDVDAWSIGISDFNGDGRPDIAFLGTSGEPGVLLGIPAGKSVTTLASALNPSTYGEQVVLTATVSPVTATGMVSFQRGSVVLGEVALSSGTATITFLRPPAGVASLIAVYQGDANDAKSASPVLVQTVNKQTLSTELTSSPNPSNLNQSVMLTASVSEGASGTITFYDGASVLGTATVAKGGNARFSTTTLSAGKHSITADFSGDNDYEPSSSPAHIQVVDAP